jgi:Glutathione S-transferase, N-terminal domain
MIIDIHYWPTPNGWKVTIMLEECGLPYKVAPVNILEGEQFEPGFRKIAPNNRIPAIIDHAPASGGGPVSIFESGAILIYLAEKTGKFLPVGGELVNFGVSRRYGAVLCRLAGVIIFNSCAICSSWRSICSLPSRNSSARAACAGSQPWTWRAS